MKVRRTGRSSGRRGNVRHILPKAPWRAAAELYVRLQIMVIRNMAPLHQVIANGVGLNAATVLADEGVKQMPLLNVVIDLSHHNTVTSFQDVKADGISGIIHKATEGTTFVDKEYNSRAVKAKSAGLFWGAYHFGTQGDPNGQADHFLSIVNPGPTDLLVLDFEPNPREGTMTLAEAEAFVQRINEKIGRFPGLYSGQSFLRGATRGSY